MKMLVVYNEKGQLIFTQTNATEQYNCLVEDVEENKEVIGVDLETNTFILVDRQTTTEEKEQIKKELETKNLELRRQEEENIKLTDKIIELTVNNIIL